MKKIIILLLSTVGVIYLVDGSLAKRSKWMGEAPVEKQSKYEEIHYTDYVQNKNYYHKWDHMTPVQLENLCQCSVFKLFVMTTDRKVIPSIIPALVTIHYEFMKNKIGTPVEPAEVAVLQCFFPETSQRAYFHYIRSPKSYCLFMVIPLSYRQWTRLGALKPMRIVNEFCHSPGKIKQAKNENRCSNELDVIPKYAVGRGRLIRSGETTPKQRFKYEMDHFKNYMFCKSEYKMWPELNAVSDKVAFCRKFILKIYGIGPIFLTHEIIPEVKRAETLVYIGIRKTINNELRSVAISVLQCNVPKSTRQRYYYLTRSSQSNCVLLVKHVAWNIPRKFGIINRLCVGDNLNKDNYESENGSG